MAFGETLNPSDDPAVALEAAKQRQQIAMLLAKQASAPRQNTHWAQALAQGLEGAVAGMEMRGATDATKSIAKLLSDGQSAGNAALLKAQGSGDGWNPDRAVQSGVPIEAVPTASPNALAPPPPVGQIPDHGREIFNGLTTRGLSPIAAAGIMGNIGGESGFNPAIGGDPDRNGNNTSFGLAQWRGPRFQALQSFAGSRGKQWQDGDTQLDFLMSELQGPEARAYASLQAAKTPEEASMAFMRDFERPARWAMEQSGPKRAAYATQAMTRFGQPTAPVQVASADPNFVPSPSGPELSPTGQQIVGMLAQREAQRPGSAMPRPEASHPVQQVAQALTNQQQRQQPSPSIVPQQRGGGLSPAEMQAVMNNRAIPQAMKLEIIKANRPDMEVIQGKDGGLYTYDKRRPGQPVRVGSMPIEQYQDVRDANGQVIGQRNTITNKTERYTPTDTSDIREYDFYSKQERTAGRTPEDFGAWTRNNRKASATTVDASVKGETEEAKERGKGLAKRMNDIAESGAKAMEDDVTLARLEQLAANVKTGGRTNVLEGIRQMTGGLVRLDPQADDVQAFSAAVNYLAPRLRVPGSGSQSERELTNFLNSIPSLAGSPEGNAKIVRTLRGIVEHRRQAADIATAYQTGDISGREASRQISELPSPFIEPPPAAAADALKADPSLREQFDQRYGRGASNRVLGRP